MKPFALFPLFLLAHLLDVVFGLLVDLELVDADDDPLAGFDLALPIEGDVLDLSLDPLILDGLSHPAALVDLLEQLERLGLEVVGQALDVVRTGERVDRVGCAGLVGEDLLGPKRRPDRLLGREAERFVLPVGVEALGAPEYRGERLVGDADDVVFDLLGRQRRARGLGVELQLLGGRLLGVEAFLHQLVPHPAGGPELRDLLQDVVMGVEEERELRREVVDVEAGLDRGLDVLEPVAERERELLGGRRPRLADVVPRNGDRIEVRDLLGTELEDVRDDPHRGLRREYVGVARDVLLEDVVLDRPAELFAIDPRLVADRDVHREQHRGGGVDRHRRRDLVEGDPLEDGLHVVQGVDGDAALADLPLCHLRVGVVAHLRRQVERHREAGLALVHEVVEPLVGLGGGPHPGVLPHRPQPPAVHRRVDAPCVGLFAGISDVLAVVEIRDVCGRVQRVDRLPARVRRELLVSFPEAIDRRAVGVVRPAVVALPDLLEVVGVEHYQII